MLQVCDTWECATAGVDDVCPFFLKKTVQQPNSVT